VLGTDLTNSLAFDLRASWQARALAEAKGQTGMVLLSVLSHSYDDALVVLLPIVFPGFVEPSLPVLASCGKIDRTGAVVADVIRRDHTVARDTVVYRSDTDLQNDFRRLADRLKLSDDDRTELFKCVQRWLVADRRLDPTFDPKDPDAKRLVLN
jgi:hypothetical protein